jgi:hypothetical protein
MGPFFDPGWVAKGARGGPPRRVPGRSMAPPGPGALYGDARSRAGPPGPERLYGEAGTRTGPRRYTAQSSPHSTSAPVK